MKIEEMLDKLSITPEQLVQMLVLNGKITIATAIKFHLKEISLEDIGRLIKEKQKDETNL